MKINLCHSIHVIQWSVWTTECNRIDCYYIYDLISISSRITLATDCWQLLERTIAHTNASMQTHYRTQIFPCHKLHGFDLNRCSFQFWVKTIPKNRQNSMEPFQKIDQSSKFPRKFNLKNRLPFVEPWP